MWRLISDGSCLGHSRLTRPADVVVHCWLCSKDAVRVPGSADARLSPLPLAGTTYYTHASALQAAAGSGSKPGIALVGALLGSHNDPSPNAAAAQQAAARRAYASAAQYIALAAAMQPGKEVYRKSLAIVKPLLALPFLRVGYLAAPAADTIGTINETWMRQWFVLDHASFRTASPVEISLSQVR